MRVNGFKRSFVVRTMPTTRVEIKGVQEFMKALRQTGDYSKEQMNKIVSDAATTTHRLSVTNISTGERSGKLYKATKGGKMHQASAPGEYPKSGTGQLVRNITMKKEEGGYTVGSRSGAPWGFWLEMKDPSQGGRPWLSRAFEEMKKYIEGKYGR